MPIVPVRFEVLVWLWLFGWLVRTRRGRVTARPERTTFAGGLGPLCGQGITDHVMELAFGSPLSRLGIRQQKCARERNTHGDGHPRDSSSKPHCVVSVEIR